MIKNANFRNNTKFAKFIFNKEFNQLITIYSKRISTKVIKSDKMRLFPKIIKTYKLINNKKQEFSNINRILNKDNKFKVKSNMKNDMVIIPNKDKKQILKFDFNDINYVDNVIVFDFDNNTSTNTTNNDMIEVKITEVKVKDNVKDNVKEVNNFKDFFDIVPKDNITENNTINISPKTSHNSHSGSKFITIKFENSNSLKEVYINVSKNKIIFNNSTKLTNSNNLKINITGNNSSINILNNSTFERFSINLSNQSYLKIQSLYCDNINIDSKDSSVIVEKMSILQNINLNIEKTDLLLQNIIGITDLQTEYDVNTKISSYANINLNAKSSEIVISKLANCDFNYKGVENNNLRVDSLNCNTFNIVLGQNDNAIIKIIKFNHNSIIDGKNGKLDYKIHPILYLGINLYFTEKKDFKKWLMFDRVGYSFCPTLIIDSKEKLDENYFLWEVFRLNTRAKMIAMLTFGFIIYNIASNENTFYKDISYFKLLQSQLKNISYDAL